MNPPAQLMECLAEHVDGIQRAAPVLMPQVLQWQEKFEHTGFCVAVYASEQVYI